MQVNTLKLALEGMEKERDFYFGKLREVELLCQDQGEESAQFVERLMEVLYSADDQVSGLTVEQSDMIEHLHPMIMPLAFCCCQSRTIRECLNQ